MDKQMTATRVKGLGWLIHVAAWGVLFCMPLFFTGNQSEIISFATYIRFITVPLTFIIIFYLNYFYLVKRFIFRKQFTRFIFINLFIIVALILIVHVLMQILPEPPGKVHPPDREWQHVVRFFIANIMIYMLVAALSVAIKMTNSWYQAEAIQKELEKSRTEAELQNLKSQLNPHFLFNTLNNIYSLIAISPDQAQASVHDLSRLLRYVLYESSQLFVSLEKEIDFLRNYIELMRIRLPKQVRIELNISPLIKGDTPIAPLLFISLIENAFKHGVSPVYASFICIDISQNEKQVSCLIRNSYFPKDNYMDKSGSGIGLINLQKRLSLLYPGRHSFTHGKEEEQYYASINIIM
ncbi:MAG: sensor histidine kinase [Tannerellaceae bacterium]|nr:sensor histidine kinase [Tannerellaceae bacterium]